MNKSAANKLIATFLTICMCFTMLVPMPIMAEATNTVFDYENYKVEYNVVNEWDGFQNIEVTITNTSDKTIYNWALGYNAGGEILNLDIHLGI